MRTFPADVQERHASFWSNSVQIAGTAMKCGGSINRTNILNLNIFISMIQKTLLLFTLMVNLFALHGSAEVLQPSTTLPADGSPEHLYTITNGNGYSMNALTAPTQTDANRGLFAFYAVDGKTGSYYIYSFGAKKWLTYTVGASYGTGTAFVTLSEQKNEQCYFVTSPVGNDSYEFSPVTAQGDKAALYFNWFQGIGASNPLDGKVSVGLWTDGGNRDNGSKWNIKEMVRHSYTVKVTGTEKIQIKGENYVSGDVYTTLQPLQQSDIVAPRQTGKFAVISIDDALHRITVAYANTPVQPAVATYANAVVYPAQQNNVGVAVVTEENGVYTLSNNVLAASFMKVDGRLYFAGCKAMNLQPGTELFVVAFGNGVRVPASAMKLRSVELVNLPANPQAVGGAEHYPGKALVAKYEYQFGDATLQTVWKAVLRDGSHYLRSEIEMTGLGDVDMHSVTPLSYMVDTKAAGSVPQVVGNTRGAVILSNKLFAGLENPVGYNSVGNAVGSDHAYELVSNKEENLQVASWLQVDEARLPMRVIEATGAAYPQVNAYTMHDFVLKKNQKVSVTVSYTGGSHRLNLGGADLLDAHGDVTASDYHKGYTGSTEKDNAFSFIAPYDGTFDLRVFAETKTETITAISKLTVAIFSPKENIVAQQDLVPIQGLWSRNTTLKNGETWKISSVVGLVAQDGQQANNDINKTQKRRSFLAYSERERAVPWHSNPVYISWYELNIDRNNALDPTGNMKASQVLNILNQWKEKLYDRYGVAPNSFVIDDGWDNYGTWTFHAGFPNEMRDIAAKAATMGAGVGAWLGPVGGYGQSGEYRRNYWKNKGGMVLSNPAYYKVFLDAATNLTQNNGNFNFFKFDGISAQFSATGPDKGDVGNENAEGIIRLERYVRENLKRDIFFNTTVGTWASPFWYHFTDATWRQEGDYGTIGNNAIDRENWITYRDRLVYQNYVASSPLCPINTLMTHGFILTSFGQVSKNMDYEACRRELRCAFACGSGMVELYNDYALMNNIADGKLWSDLAECIQWQKRNADVLPDIHWVGGNPWNGVKTAVYGWAAWNGTKSVLTLRNGGNDEQTYQFTLREALNIPANVNGSVVLRKSFGEQAALNGLQEGVSIDIDRSLIVKLPGSSVYSFEGLDASVSAVNVTSIALVAERDNRQVEVGKTFVLRTNVLPTDVTYPVCAWTSSDTETATVYNGCVKGLKPGKVMIKAMALDGSGVETEIEIEVVKATIGEQQPYAVNFDKQTQPVNTQRHLNAISLIADNNTPQLVTIGSRMPYVDLTADDAKRFVCNTGATLTVKFDYAGTWMHGYVYVDEDHDKQFSFVEGNTNQQGSELRAFSFYSGNPFQDGSGVNSLGENISGNARNILNPPSFTAPKKTGDYRMRFKIDWNSVDAGGRKAADGTCTGGNGILANGGVIVDAILQVENDLTDIEKVETDSVGQPVFYDLHGRRLEKAPVHGVYIQKGNSAKKIAK